MIRVLVSLLTLAALGGMAYGQYLIRIDPNDARATTLFLIAAVAAALLLGRESAPAEELGGLARRSRRARLLGAAGTGLGLLGIAGGSYLLSQQWELWFSYGWALIIGGTALMSVGVRGFDPPGERDRSWTWNEVVALLVIVAIGTGLRFHRYTDFPDPFGMHAIEEPQAGMRAYTLLKDHVHGWEFLFDNYLGALGIMLAGDRSFPAIRVPFTAVSALTIVPVYMLLRQLVSAAPALGATFLFAVSSWNIIYSRCAHNIFATNIIVVTALMLLLHAARSRRLAVMPWAGLLCGYTLYDYAAYRGTTLFAVVFLATVFASDLWRWWRAKDDAVKRLGARLMLRDVCAGATVVAMAVALFVPIAVITVSNRAQPSYYFEAANRSLSNRSYYTNDPRAFLAQRLERMRAAARIFMHEGDRSTTFNAPAEPMIDPLTSVFFMGGLCVAFCYPRRGFNGFLLFMFVALMFGGTVFVQNLDVRRLQGVTPFVAVFAALFLDRLWRWVQRLPRALLWIVLPPLIGGGAAFAAWWNYDVYFHKMASEPVVRQTFKNQYTILIHYGRLHPKDQMIVLTDVHHFFEPSDYFWLIDGLMQGRTVWDIDDVLPPHEFPVTDQKQTIIIQNPYERHAVARLLMDVYPGMTCTEFTEPEYAFISLTTCDVPRGVSPRPLVMTLEGRYWLGDGPAGEPAQVQSEPFLSYATTPAACSHERPQTPENCYAEWTGTLEIPADGAYHFVAKRRGDAHFNIRIDGQPLRSGDVRLTAGAHQLTAQARMRRGADWGVGLDWNTANGFEPVPFYRVGDEPAVRAEN